MSKFVILGSAHGSDVAGKHSPDYALREYQYSREICQRVKAALTAKGVACCIDIEGEREGGLNNRVKLVNKLVAAHGGAGNCIYISIHNNAAGSGGWHNAQGFCVYCYTSASATSIRMAKVFHANAQAAGLKGNRSYPATGYYTANFAVLRSTSCPAVLTENLFQDNRKDVAYLLSDAGKQAITQLHVKSIMEVI